MNQIQLGPLTLPVPLLLAVLSLLTGSLAAGIGYRKKKDVRSLFFDTLSSALIVFLVTWKLFPLVYNFSLIKTPLALLYTPGGLPGIISGLILGLLYYGVKTAGTARALRRDFLFILLLFTATSIFSGAILSTAYNHFTPKENTQKAFIFSAEDTEGKDVSLEEFRGKTVILNFWATWCPPCRGELPILTSFAENLPAGTVILGINSTSSEKSRETVTAFTQKKGINFPVLFDLDGRIAAKYSVRTLPTTIIISKNGNITGKKTGAVDMHWLRSQLPK